MYKALSPGAIGVSAPTLEDAINAATLGGFDGVEINPREVAVRIEEKGAEAVRALYADAGVRPAAWGLPTEWRGDEAAFQSSLRELPRLARAAAEIGCTRVSTYVLPSSDERDYDENYRFHVDRFTPVAAALAEAGCSLGLEFIGPKTLRDGKRHEFIHTMDGMLEMGREIGPNVGLLLDCWHWYTSHGTVEDLRALDPAQVVYVHVNDAPSGVPIDEQVDNVRALPGETGVIDIAQFLGALLSVGYDGPVTPEPFKKELADLPSDEDRLRTVGTAMDKIMSTDG